jgi:hypothetical protein
MALKADDGAIDAWHTDVADVAVGMGPRNTRRLITSGVTVCAVVAICALLLWLFGGLPYVSSTDHSRSSTPVEHVITLIPQQAGLPYGMTKQQMLRRLGQPARIAGQCWQYPENIKDFSQPARLINAVRLCFYAGQYQVWFVEIDGTWRMPGSTFERIAPPTTIQPSPLGR